MSSAVTCSTCRWFRRPVPLLSASTRASPLPARAGAAFQPRQHAFRLASESIRNCPDATTVSPSFSPPSTSVSLPTSLPTVTVTGWSRPSRCFTMTIERLPVAITASDGTSRRDTLCRAATRTRISMPGVSFSAALSISTRACSVRLLALMPGSTSRMRPVKCCAGSPANVASTAIPGCTVSASASGTSTMSLRRQPGDLRERLTGRDHRARARSAR